MNNRLYTFRSSTKPKYICLEAARLLDQCYVTPGVVMALGKMKPARQVESAEHIVASANTSVVFARGLLEITPLESRRAMPGNRLYPRSQSLVNFLQRQAEPLVRKLNRFRETHGADMLTLTVSCKYIEQLLANNRVAHYVSRFHPKAMRSLRLVLWTTPAKPTNKARRFLNTRPSTRNTHKQMILPPDHFASYSDCSFEL